MDEVKDYDSELDKLCSEIRKGIDGLSQMKSLDAQKQNKITYLQGRINRAKQVYRSLKVSLRELSKVEQESWQKKCTEHSTTINQLIKDLNWGESPPSVEDNTGGMGGILPTTDQILKKGEDIQKKDLASLDHLIQIIEADKTIGSEMGRKLGEQTEQLQRVGGDIEEINDHLKLGGRQLRSFARRIATDKLILALICLIICGVILIIVWPFIKDTYNKNTS